MLWRSGEAGAKPTFVPTPDQVFFEAVTMPHRSLSRRALGVLLAAICLGLATTSLGFMLRGAWPVGGFALAVFLLFAWLLRLNVLAARASEIILLSESNLLILRTDPKGRRSETSLPPAWLNLILREEPGRVPVLLLVIRGRQEEIGRSLGEAEKRALATALSDALHRWRHPQFDNPQLRGDA
jgi:uncharacterized membrane protein